MKKKILSKLRGKILIYDLLFIGINCVINFILYCLNIRFRLWVIFLILVIAVLGFIIGIIEQLFRCVRNKKIALLVTVVGLIAGGTLFVIFLPFLTLIFAFSILPEHTVVLDDKTYVATVNSFLRVNVNYYDYYGPLLMGTKVRVYGYFGKGGFDPFGETNPATAVEYTFYDYNGKVISRRVDILKKNTDGEIVEKDSMEIPLPNDDGNTNQNANDSYLLPEDFPVLYEKKFNNTILRFIQTDSVLGQNMQVMVLKSTDNGKNFYFVNKETAVIVSNEAQFGFFNENLGYIIVDNKLFWNKKADLYVTTDGGNSFTIANFQYDIADGEFLYIEKLPYYEGDTLVLECIKYLSKAEKQTIIFKSTDNGLNWYL